MSYDEEPDYEGDMKREFDKLRAELAEATARAEKAEEDAQHAREESASAFDAAATHLARAEKAEAERDRLRLAAIKRARGET